MPYEPKRGEVCLFENEKMGNERAPDHRGYVVAHRDIKAGERLAVAIWRSKADSCRSYSGTMTDLPGKGSNAVELDLFGNAVTNTGTQPNRK